MAEPNCQTYQPLPEAIAKAHRWQEQFDSGEYADVADLAKAREWIGPTSAGYSSSRR